MSDVKVPRMRTVSEIVEYFKKHDPDTKINQWNVRRMLKTGQIPYEKAGNRYLINLDYEQNRIINPDHLRTHPGMDGLSFMAWDLRGSPGNLFNTGRG